MTDETPTDETTKQLISALSERLHFFFSNANLRQDKWMRTELEKSGCLSLDTLLRFQTIKKISEDKALLARAAGGEDETLGRRVKELVVFDKEREEVRRVIPWDWKTMGDGSKLSLWVKHIPLTEPEEGGEGDEVKEARTFKPRYAVTRDEVKALFEPYGRVGIVQLRYGHKQPDGENENNGRGGHPSGRRNNRGESYPLGAAIVEFEDEEGMKNACLDLLPPESEQDDKEEKGDNGDEKKESEPKTVLELKGNKLSVRKMKPLKCFAQDNGKEKRSRDDGDNAKTVPKHKDEEEDKEPEVEFEPVTVDWEKGCVIALAGLSSEKCDRESIREAVSVILGVTKDVKTSGLYVDYNRGETVGKLRMKDVTKSAEMKELVDKLSDGTVLIAGEKVESAKILEGEEEEEYWKKFVDFLNNRKRQREEEKAQTRKRQKRFSGGGGRGGFGRGRGGRGRRR
ncbi:hypothetical protein HJC23_010164 [Cyclotella cryptica]|uniref:HTH La-type RNA-binding domain-containing protein n=1 Tax=Cyclotella cryptica TaxID=29204 RepID=A0ABD3P819_9STRA|eukprot:CCRYP_017851-RA/>CCRYP_017851-RA protein AED:0.00 eAED:0.00 QI:152/-1/1/1/-1/1/1/389/455